MPRSENAEIVYVLLSLDGELKPTVEVHGTRTEAEFAGEALARSKGYTNAEYRYEASGELVGVRKRSGVRFSTWIFVLQQKIIRKPRVLKGKPNA